MSSSRTSRGEREAVQRQLAGDGGAQLGRPLVHVHRGVQAAGLLEVDLGGAGRAHPVEPHRGGGEEPVGVEVRAPDRMRLDDGVGAVRTQPQRQRVPVLALPVDHRPLVQAEAAGERRPGTRSRPAAGARSGRCRRGRRGTPRRPGAPRRRRRWRTSARPACGAGGRRAPGRRRRPGASGGAARAGCCSTRTGSPRRRAARRGRGGPGARRSARRPARRAPRPGPSSPRRTGGRDGRTPAQGRAVSRARCPAG